MKRALAAALACCCVLAGCGERPLLRDAEGRYRLVARHLADAAAAQVHTRRMLDEHSLDVLYVDDVALLRGANAARGGADAPVIVLGDAAPADVNDLLDAGGAAAVVTCREQAAAALELALLAIGGVAVPQRLPLGVRWFTRSNRAADGAPQPAPGDYALAVLRLEHSAILGRDPARDVVLRIAVLDETDGARFISPLQDAAARRGQVQLLVCAVTTTPDSAERDRTVDQWLASNVNALLVAGATPDERRELRQRARAQRITVVALGAEPVDTELTAWVGPFQPALGAAAAAAVQQLRPLGASIAALASGNDEASALRQQGFANALGLKAP